MIIGGALNVGVVFVRLCKKVVMALELCGLSQLLLSFLVQQTHVDRKRQLLGVELAWFVTSRD